MNEVEYYENEDNFGGHQFVSLKDIINQFMVAYVGQDKIIAKINKADVVFHALRGAQELSFDTFKSCRGQEFTVGASLQVPLPIDYINYTKVSWVDAMGIKHPIYPSLVTSNPKVLPQDPDGEPRVAVTATGGQGTNVGYGNDPKLLILDGIYDGIKQGMRVTGVHGIPPNTFVVDWYLDMDSHSFTKVILSNATTEFFNEGQTYKFYESNGSLASLNDEEFDLLAANGNGQAIGGFRCFAGKNYVYQTVSVSGAVDMSKVQVGMNFNMKFFPEGTKVIGKNPPPTNTSIMSNPNNYIFLDQVASAGSVSQDMHYVKLTVPTKDSIAWKNFKKKHDLISQKQYGLDPQHANSNGTYYIDCMSGKIHFSSNLAGKTVILDYISGIESNDPAQVEIHKMAEEAMYKHIAHSVLSTRLGAPEYLIARFKKERFAAIRTAKLRLSNIKIEEITQILRGKSKQIKH